MVDEFEEFFGIFDEMEASEEEAANQLQIPEDVFDENDINPPSLDTFSLEVQKETLRRIKVINFVEKRLEGGWTEKNLTPILDTVEQTLSLKPPSWRILAGWKKLYFESGRDIKSLIPKHAQKGNRNKSSDSQVLVDEAIEKKYLTKERLSIAEAFRYYKSRVITINQTIIDGAIEPISQRTFYDRVNSLPPYEVAVARYGKRYADREFRLPQSLLGFFMKQYNHNRQRTIRWRPLNKLRHLFLCRESCLIRR